MPDTSPPQQPLTRQPTMSAQQAERGKTAREQLQQRVGQYKRRIVVAAIIGFGVVSFLIANPDLGIAAPSRSTTSQQDPSNFLNQQGGNSNGNGTSQQQPSTSSRTS